MLKPLIYTLFLCSLIGCAENMTTDSVGTDDPSAIADKDSPLWEPSVGIRGDAADAPAAGPSTAVSSPPAQGSVAQEVSDAHVQASPEGQTASDDSDESVEESSDSDDEPAEVAEGETEDEDVVPTTPEEYVDAINKKLAPTEMDIPGAIELTEEAYAKFPDDPAILQGLIGLLSQSLQRERDDDVVNQRRMRLGELAREWIERNKDSVDSLGNMPVLFLEEAKAHLAAKDPEKAFASVRQARDLGFEQATLLLFYDPAFAELLTNEKAKAEIKKWLAEDVQEQIAETKTFPFDFSLTSFAGEEKTKADFTQQGKILIVDFWGTWCPPCRKEIPHFVELLKKRPDQVAVVGINIEDPTGAPVEFEEAKARFDEFVQTQPVTYPCLAGDRETVEQVPDFEGYPTTLFLDDQGQVRLKLTGYQPLEVLEAAVDQLLKN